MTNGTRRFVTFEDPVRPGPSVPRGRAVLLVFAVVSALLLVSSWPAPGQARSLARDPLWRAVTDLADAQKAKKAEAKLRTKSTRAAEAAM